MTTLFRKKVVALAMKILRYKFFLKKNKKSVDKEKKLMYNKNRSARTTKKYIEK